jgi:hypothetical protein
MNVTGSWRIVSSPDFDDVYLRMELEPYVELHQRGDRVSGTYHVGLQQGEIDGRIEGADRIVFSFEGMDEMEEVHGRGALQIDGAQARFALEYYQGDTFTFMCEQPT